MTNGAERRGHRMIYGQLLSVFCNLPTACLAWFYMIFTVAVKCDELIYLQGENIPIIFQSSDFPNSCCEAQNITISAGHIAAVNKSIFITFSDFDVPVGTYFMFQNASNHQFNEQIEVSKKRPLQYTTRTLMFDSDVVKLMVLPTHTQPSDYYAGFRFKAVLQLNSQDKRHYWRTSERCPALNSVIQGGLIDLRWYETDPANTFRSLPSVPMYDCIWVLKVPPEFEDENQSEEGKPLVFFRIDKLEMAEELRKDFSLQIVVGRYSRSTEDRLNYNYDNTLDGYRSLTSATSLYVRFQMPYFSINYTGTETYSYHVKFDYGLMSKWTDTYGNECVVGPLPGFICSWSDMCVPQGNMCDNIEQCKLAEDEQSHVCDGGYLPETTTPMPTTTTSSPPLRSCPYYFRLLTPCPDGRCIPHFYMSCDETCDSLLLSMCPDNICGFYGYECPSGELLCSSYQKKCEEDNKCIYSYETCPSDKDYCDTYTNKRCSDGQCISISETCPEDSCPSSKPNRCGSPSSRCYYESSKCDDACDCYDCSDEDNCGFSLSLKKKWLFFLFALPLGIAACCFCCKTLNKKPDEGTARPVTTGQVHQPQPRHTGSTSHTYGPSTHTISTGRSTHPAAPGGYYTPVPTAEAPEDRQEPAAAFAPPQYHAATDPILYPPTPRQARTDANSTEPSSPDKDDIENLPPPPSYESATSGVAYS